MALIAALEFGDNNIGRYSKSYLVSDCRFVFNRPYNSYRPEGMARCERLELEVIAPGKNDLNLFDWYDKQGVQSGRIVISMRKTPRSSISRMPSASRFQRVITSIPHGVAV